MSFKLSVETKLHCKNVNLALFIRCDYLACLFCETFPETTPIVVGNINTHTEKKKFMRKVQH